MKRLPPIPARVKKGFVKGLAIVAGGLLVALAVPVVMAASRATLEAPEPTLLLRDRHGRFLGEIGPGDDPDAERGYWPVDELPERVVAATVAIEDRRFYKHPGVDPVAVGRALWQNVSNRERVSGASTLAMQIARMQRPGDRTLPRKGVEALTALFITARYDPDEVLAHYLRLAPYGNQIRGISYASRCYFDKPVQDLSWAEVAFLTALPQAPGRMNPFSASGRQAAIERGGRILDLLYARQVMSAEEYELAKAQITELQSPQRNQRPLEALHAVFAIEDRISSTGEWQTLGSRPVIDTTLDLDLQRAVAGMTLDAVKRWDDQGAGNAAVIVVDRETAEILAWVGSADYFAADQAGSIDYARTPRSSGSTLKPFLYALALERGTITPATVLDDLERGAGGIANADERYLGPMLPRAALANSRNVPASNLLASIGLDEGYGFLGQLGLHDNELSAGHYGLGMSIGGLYVTLEQVVQAYTVLAGDGRLRELVWLRPEWDAAPSPADERQLIAEDTARLISLFLSDPTARMPSFPRMGSTEYPFPVAIKTGTSSRYRDAWTAAYSDRYLVGVWVGHPDATPMKRLGGSRSAAVLAREGLYHLHDDRLDGLADVPFPAPRGYSGVRICSLTGQLATNACDRTVLEHFAPGTAPVQPCDAHIQVAVDTRDGLLASPATPPEHMQVRTFVDLPPRYASWALSSGLVPPPVQVSALSPDARGPTPGATPPSPGPLPISFDGVALHITSPEQGVRLLRDPETPPELSTVALNVVVNPPVDQIVWYVDGAPFQITDFPYTARWPLEPGEHTFQARVPHTSVMSSRVKIQVQ